NTETGMSENSANTRRLGHPEDKIVTTPAIQLYDFSNATFRTALDMVGRSQDDLIYVITKDGLSDTTVNRVRAYYATDLTLKWTFNDDASRKVEPSSDGPTVDYGLNSLYFGTNL